MPHHIKIQALKYHRACTDLKATPEQAWDCVKQEFGLSLGEIATLKDISIVWLS